MLHSRLILLELLPTRSNDHKISLPQMRRAFMVRERWQRLTTKMSLWSASLPVSGAAGRRYRDALRSAGSRCLPPEDRHEDLPLSGSSKERISTDNQDRVNSGGNWIERKGNGIASCDLDGQRTIRASRRKKRFARWIDLAINRNSTKTTRNRRG